MLNEFYMVLGPHPNLAGDIAGVGSLKDANVAICGLKSLDLTRKTINISVVRIFSNKKLEDDINVCMTVKTIYNMFELWRMRHLPLQGKIIIFKSLYLFKIAYLALLTISPKNIMDELNKIQKNFLWSNKKGNKKHGTLVHSVMITNLKV